MSDIDIGQRVSDSVTGFAGIVVAKTVFLGGHCRCEVQPEELSDCRPVASEWIDMCRLQPAPNEPVGFAKGKP